MTVQWKFCIGADFLTKSGTITVKTHEDSARLLFTGSGEIRFLPVCHNQSLQVSSFVLLQEDMVLFLFRVQFHFKQEMQSRVKRLFVPACKKV